MTDVFHIKEYNKFRHAAELKKDTHGGYLEGSLAIPKELIGYEFELELSLVSSSLSSRNEHPNLLHFTELEVGKKKRKVSSYKTEVTEDSWKTAFYFSGSSSEVLHYFKDDKGVDEIIRITDCRKGDSIIFGGDFGLTLTIITPLQNAGVRGKGVTITQVLENRYSSNSVDWLKSTDSHDPKIELHRCRVQAVFRCPIKNYRVSLLSNNIFDLSNKYVGKLSILAIHNMEDSIFGAIGKKEVMLITKQKINPKQVFPDLMIRSDEGIYVDPAQVFKGFCPIAQETTKCYHNTTLIFDIPTQTPRVLEQIADTIFYICLNRRKDGRLSDPIKSFRYTSDLGDDDLMTMLSNDLLGPMDFNEQPLSISSIPSPAESGFVSAEPSPCIFPSHDEPSLTPNYEMFQSSLDVDMTELDMLSLPLDSSLISTDHAAESGLNSGKKDIDELARIFEDSFSIEKEASDVKGFPTLTFGSSSDESTPGTKEENTFGLEEVHQGEPDTGSSKIINVSLVGVAMVPIVATIAFYIFY